MGVEVEVPCVCPPDGTRHETDRVTLRDRLDFRGASSIRNAVIVFRVGAPEASVAEVMAVLTEAYILAGVSDWTVENDAGPIAVSRASLVEVLFPRLDAAMRVGEAADELYGEVMRPLVLRAFAPSPSSPTPGSTSRTNGSRPRRPRPSRRSSTSITRTADTAPISRPPDGGYNSSPNSASVD